MAALDTHNSMFLFCAAQNNATVTHVDGTLYESYEKLVGLVS